MYTETNVLCVTAVLVELKTHKGNWFHVGVLWTKAS